MNIAAIIPASGNSERMGKPKNLLMIDDKSIIAWQGESLTKSRIQEILVIGHSWLKEYIPPDLLFIDSKNEITEMIGSVRLGIKNLSEGNEAIIIVPSDFPLFSNDIVNLLIQNHRQNKNMIIVPVFNERRGHPILIPTLFYDEILNSFSGEGLRGLFRKYPDQILNLPCSDRKIHLNINTPEDLKYCNYLLKKNNLS